MGKITGYLEYPRVHEEYAPVKERVLHFKEFIKTLPRDKAEIQAARCMSCGTPFCTNACPLHNVDPDFSDAIYNKKWKEAYDILSSTNNFLRSPGASARRSARRPAPLPSMTRRLATSQSSARSSTTPGRTAT